MRKRKIILDCDPGHDDAIAIMLAAKAQNLELLGIGVSAGNQTLEKTGRNTLNLVQYLNIDVPVALGNEFPLVKEPVICPEIHGETGLDGFTFPPLKRSFDKRSSHEMMRDLILKNKKVTLVSTGALTNIATLLMKYPEVLPHIDELVMMGGAIEQGNVTPAAEFNIFVDPEAADYVFKSGLKIKMMGLDVTRHVKTYPSIVKRMEKIHNKASDLFVALMKVFNANQKKMFGFKGGPLHDPVTIVYLIDRSVVTLKYMNTRIDVSKGISYGRTNCDQYGYMGLEPNSYVAVKINTKKYWDVIENILKEYSK